MTIRADQLVKDYGRRRVVDHLDLEVSPGEIVGLLGPNGAGKTTTMRAITGYISPEKGDVWVAGYNMRKNSLEARERK